MPDLILIETPEQLAALATSDQLSGTNIHTNIHTNGHLLSLHQPDAHWVLVGDRQITAHCSLWWRNLPAYEHHRLGSIGHYGAEDAESAKALLTHACQQLSQQGCTLAIAPIDGNTWRRYRLITERGTEPLFFLEPDNPDEWVEHFEQQEFTPLARYSSALNTDLTQVDPRLERTSERLRQQGIQMRSLDVEQLESELQRIHQLSLVSFQHNFLYTPIEQAEFVAQYSQIRPYLQPELVLLAEQGDQLVGFLFALPDVLQAKRRQAVDTIIIKTVAVLPGRASAGLGSVLVGECQAIAHRLGYRRAIHALMHEDNRSRNISDRYAQTIRRYALFAKTLSPVNEIRT